MSLPRGWTSPRRPGFAADQRAVAAVEFALIFPVMALLYLGGTDLTQAIGLDRKVSLAARVAADLIGRASTAVTDADLTTVCQGTMAMVAPFSTSKLNVTISTIVTDATGNSKIGWSRKFTGGNCTTSAAGRTAGTTVAPPAGLATNGASLVWTETSYAYDSMFDTIISSTGIINLSESSYMRPRLLTTVCYKTC